MNKPFTPSAHQQALFNWVTEGQGSCILTAVAGSGKTTTLIQALKLMKGSIFFGAFNKKIADEIAQKAGMRIGLTISTIHAAGFRAWRKVANSKVNNDKMRDIFQEVTFRSITSGILQGPVLKLVSLAKQSGMGIFHKASITEEWQNLVDHFGIDCFDEKRGEDNTMLIIELAQQCFEKSINYNKNEIDFDDMIFAPLYHNAKFDKFDWVLIDEAQDTNAVRRELCLRMMKDTSRLLAVGDNHQAIYGFTGADSKALDLIAEQTQAIRLPLTTSFRCAKNIVAHAKNWVNHIHAHEHAIDGVVEDMNEELLKTSVKVGDAILCRFNAPLVKYVYQLILAGIPAKIEGREIGANLVKLANRWKVTSASSLIEKLDKYLERETKKWTEKQKEQKITEVQDQVDCLKVIIERVLSKGHPKDIRAAIKDEVEMMFGDDQNTKPVVVLSSIHKSKGREFPSVYWIQTKPNSFAKQIWELEQEDNLSYVATTRAISKLVLVKLAEKN